MNEEEIAKDKEIAKMLGMSLKKYQEQMKRVRALIKKKINNMEEVYE